MSSIKISRYVNKRCLLNIQSQHLCTSKCGDVKGSSKGSGSKIDGGDNPSEPSMYDCRKYGHNLPCNNICPPFEPLPWIPTGIFRCTTGEMLGRGASKCAYYKNPEYFSYHHMTFYDMHLILKPCRKPAARTGRKPGNILN